MINEKTFSLVGPGRLGTTLAYNLVLNGWECCNIVSRSEKTVLKSIEAFRNTVMTSSFSDATVAARHIFLTVPDDSIKTVADEIVRSGLQVENRIILHFSGALDSEQLAGPAAKGADVGSLHPLYCFPVDAERLPSGILFCFEGDLKTRFSAEALCADLKGIFFHIDKSKKVLYHCGASLGGNMSLTLLYLAAGLIAKALGEKREGYRGSLSLLMRSALKNLEGSDWNRALTGPVKRGDTETIRKHLDALDKNAEPEVKELYILLKKLTEAMIFSD